MTYNCKMCGGKLNIKEGDSICTCDYCGTVNTVPKVNDLRLTNLFNRANYQRMHNDFDKASAIYETILDEDNTMRKHTGDLFCVNMVSSM